MDIQDARIGKTKELVGRTVREILMKQGITGVTHVEVSRLSKVSRATLYRHWPGVMDLAFAGLEAIQMKVDFPHGPDFVHDLAMGALNTSNQLQGELGDLLRPFIAMVPNPNVALEGLFQSAVNKFMGCFYHHHPHGTISNEEGAFALGLLAGPVFLRWMVRGSPFTWNDHMELAKVVVAWFEKKS